MWCAVPAENKGVITRLDRVIPVIAGIRVYWDRPVKPGDDSCKC
jgi:hypothetical protein